MTAPSAPTFPEGRWRTVSYLVPDHEQCDMTFAVGARMIHIEHVPNGYEKGRGFYRLLIAVPYQ